MSPPPDRYGDAVRARRTELRSERLPLSGTHRAELRTVLALSRLAADDAVAQAVDRLGAVARARVEHPGRGARRALMSEVPAGLAAAVRDAHARWAAELAPALRRLAGARRLVLRPGWPDLPGPGWDGRITAVLPGPPPARSWLTGAVEGLALSRLAVLPLAALPLVGLPALGGPGWAPAAVGIGAAGVAVAVRARRLAVERAVLLRWVDAAAAGTRQGFVADIDRIVLRLEPVLGVELDTAVERRRAEVDAELRAVAGG